MKTLKLSNSAQIIRVDNEDYPVLARLNWYLSDTGYAITDTPVKHLKMHKLLIGGLPPRTVIDHIDRDKLNNQKSNLRVISQRDNTINSGRVENAKHFYFEVRRKKWVVDSRSLGVRGMYVDNPTIADRVVKRLKLGFPKDLAESEAYNPTIAITNWLVHDIDYKTYKDSTIEGMSVKEYRRKISKRGKKVTA